MKRPAMTNTLREDLRAAARPTFMDKVVSLFSPRTAMDRVRWRMTTAALSAYRAAESDRTTKNWVTSTGDANADTLGSLQELRERTRDLVRNNPIASGYITRRAANVIGSGITPQSRPDADALGISRDAAAPIVKLMERAWERWTPHADAYGEMDFAEIQNLVERQLTENGEALVLRTYDDSGSRHYGTCYQVIEPDQLCSPNNLDTAQVRGGLEYDASGRLIAYHFRQAHPGDTFGYQKANVWKRIPVYDAQGRRNVFHLKHILRPNQSRGVSLLAAVILKLQKIDKYDEAELMKELIASCFSLWIESTNPLDMAVANQTTTDSKSKRVEELEPGMIEYVPLGTKVTPSSPNSPPTSYDAFILRNLRTIAAGLGISYEGLTADFSNSTYSSARSAILEDRNLYRYFQQYIIKKLCQPVWEQVQEEAWLLGELGGFDFYSDPWAWCRCRWVPPGWSWVDPEKEVNAAIKAMQNHISTLSDECAASGRDWEENLEQAAREKAKAEELGIELSVNPGAQPPQAAPGKKEEPENGEDEKSSKRTR